MKFVDWMPNLAILVEATIATARTRPLGNQAAWDVMTATVEHCGLSFTLECHCTAALTYGGGEPSSLDLGVWFHVPTAWGGDGVARMEGHAFSVIDRRRLRTDAEAWEAAFNDAFVQLEERSEAFAKLARAWREREQIAAAVPPGQPGGSGSHRL